MSKKKKNVSKQRDMFMPGSYKDIVKRPKPLPLSPEEEKAIHIHKTIDADTLKALQALEVAVPATAVSTSPQTKTVSRKKDAEIRADYKKYEYKCSDKIEIPGTIAKTRRNEVIINGHKIKLGDSLFELFFKLVIAAKKGKGGWVAMATKAGHYQIYTNLRRALEGSLLEKDGQKFIENDGVKRYRISTHPDFITYNKEKLSQNSNPAIKALTRHLPRG